MMFFFHQALSSLTFCQIDLLVWNVFIDYSGIRSWRIDPQPILRPRLPLLFGWRGVSVLLRIYRPPWLSLADRPGNNANWLWDRITSKHFGQRRVLEMHLHIFHGSDSHLIVISNFLFLRKSPSLIKVFIIILFVLWLWSFVISLLHIISIEDIGHTLDVLASKFVRVHKDRVFSLNVVKFSLQDVIFGFLFLFNLFLFSSRM
jgi:hypothetical protein